MDEALCGVSGNVAILMCTYRGENYLHEQLCSFMSQSLSNWTLHVSDDGSCESTLAILKRFKDKQLLGRVSMWMGPGKGFVGNFFSLLSKKSINADYYAFADQDDIWESDKLERAIRWLSRVPAEFPALYCARTRLIDAGRDEIGLSPLFTRPPSFANALVQNIGGGNTMVFNNSAKKLIELAESDSVVSHDWWAYMVVIGCGGRVFYDAYPSLRYRQHDSNLVGMNLGWKARLRRIHMLWRGVYRRWNDKNIACLQKVEEKLTPENRKILDAFVSARNGGALTRLVALKKSGVYRQTLFGNLALIAAVVLKKL